MNALKAFDIKLFYVFYGLADKNKKREAFFLAVAEYSEYFFYAIYFFELLLAFFCNRPFLPRLIIFPFFAMVCNLLLRRAINAKRPFILLKINNKSKHKANGSFPSNHATAAMIIALSAVKALSVWIFIPLAVLTGISRIVVGAHFPKDVLAGWIIAFAFFILM